jgi:hypothetical protein
MAINVCSNNNWSGVHDTQVELNAPNSSNVCIENYNGEELPFQAPYNVPFAVPSSGVTVTLLSTQGTYHYNTSGCPGGGEIPFTNPKTVIIG